MNGRITVNDELESKWKERATFFVTVLCDNSYRSIPPRNPNAGVIYLVTVLKLHCFSSSHFSDHSISYRIPLCLAL
jgi:hypothetical protein